MRATDEMWMHGESPFLYLRRGPMLIVISGLTDEPYLFLCRIALFVGSRYFSDCRDSRVRANVW
jgi:hypothetical protein